MDFIPDHPIIRNMETTGYPDGTEPDEPRCPVCGASAPDEIYMHNRELIGCSTCIRAQNTDDNPEFTAKDETNICPVCGSACDYGYFSKTGTVIGCNTCIEPKSPWETEECFSSRKE